LRISPVRDKARVTAGLKCAPDMGAKASIRAKSTKATATAFTNTVTPRSTPMVIGRMVLAIATMTRNMVPISSAVSFCLRVFISIPLNNKVDFIYLYLILTSNNKLLNT